MLSRYIQHPITGKLFPMNSDIGKSILKEYLVRTGGGSEKNGVDAGAVVKLL